MTINKAIVTVTAENKTRMVGEQNPLLTITYTGFKGTEYEAYLDELPLAETVEDIDRPAGEYPITINGGADVNYELVPVNGILLVTKTIQTITFDALASKTYGVAPFELTALASSGLSVSFQSSDPTVASISGNLVTIHKAGTVTITATQSGDDDYNEASAQQQLIIDKAALTVSADDKVISYGDDWPVLTISYVGFIEGDDASDLDVPPSADILPPLAEVKLKGQIDQFARAGIRSISVHDGDDDNYAFEYISGWLTINKAILTVAADNKTRMVGEQNPLLTITYTGFKGTENEGHLDEIPQAGAAADIDSPIGAYPITVNGGADANYELVLIDGVLVVTKPNQTISFDALASKTYGDAPFELTAVSSSGLPLSFESSDPTIASIQGTTVTILRAGSVTVTASQAGDANFLPAENVQQTLLINKANQIITFGTLATKFYGEPPLEVSTLTDTGLSLTYESSDPAIASILGQVVTIHNAGTVLITASQAGNENYLESSVQQNLLIEKATLIATPDNKIVTYGDDMPVTDFSYSGLVGDDYVNEINTKPSAQLTPVQVVINEQVQPPQFASVGVYEITSNKDGNDDNYAFNYSTGTLTINKTILTATAENQTKFAGGQNPELTINYVGFKGTEDVGHLDEAPLATTTATVDSPEGEYPISITGGVARNYYLVLVDGILSVARNSQTIIFNELPAKNYGDDPFELSGTTTSGLPLSYLSSDPTIASIKGISLQS